MAATLIALSVAAMAAAQTPNTFQIVGNSGASAQQMFLTTERTVQIVDKTERNGNNSFLIGGHFAWSAEYDIELNTATPRDIITNSFCAGGGVLANGTWVNVGGNQAVVAEGSTATDPGEGPYMDLSGGATVRILDSCPPNSETYCSAEWLEYQGMPTNRWYPTLETMNDGSVMIIGGELYGGYVDDADQNQNAPNYEFIPPKGAGTIPMDFLTDAQPLALFPLTWLLPSGNLLMQAGNIAQTYNIETQVETRLPNIPGGQRVYPASAGAAALPMTPANNYSLTAVFCGGLNQNVATDYNPTLYDVTQFPGVTSCQTITPDLEQTWVETDDLLQGTVMLNFLNLPDGRIFGLSGCGNGTAGYGWQDFGNGQGYGKVPRLMPAGYYNHSAPAGSRWSNEGITASTVPRMYHSSATLLPDGSILVAGSNPSADFVGVNSAGQDFNSTDPFLTEYRVERFYPDYIGKPRPVPSNLPSNISYGGNYFQVDLPANNITSKADLDSIKIVLIRPGFSTHAVNFGQRHVELPVSYSWNMDGSATLNIGQLPPNPNVLAPGPVLFFVMLNGVPSVAKFVTVGNGIIGTQPTAAASVLPPNSLAYLSVLSSSSAAVATASASASAAAVAAHKSTSTAEIAGGVAGGAAALLLLAGLVVFCLRRRRVNAQQATRGTYAPAALTQDIGYPTMPYNGNRSQQSSQQDLLKRPAYGYHQASTGTLPYRDYPSSRSSSHSDLKR